MGSSSDTTEGLTVLVADEDTEALHSTARVLGELGHQVAAYAVSVSQAAERSPRRTPTCPSSSVHEDLEHALDLIDELSETARGPVVAVVETSTRATSSPAPPSAGSTRYARSAGPEAVQGAIESRCAATARGAAGRQVDQLEGALSAGS